MELILHFSPRKPPSRKISLNHTVRPRPRPLALQDICHENDDNEVSTVFTWRQRANIDGCPADEGCHLLLPPPSLDVVFNKSNANARSGRSLCNDQSKCIVDFSQKIQPLMCVQTLCAELPYRVKVKLWPGSSRRRNGVRKGGFLPLGRSVVKNFNLDMRPQTATAN